MSHLNVAKFGGTSVADFAAMGRCADIIVANTNTRVVVVSASAGVTNCLVDLAKGQMSKPQIEEQLQKIIKIETRLLENLACTADIEEKLQHMLEHITVLASSPEMISNSMLKDELLSYGERMSSLIFTEVLKTKSVSALNFDVRKVIKTDSNFSKALPDIDAIKVLAQELMLPELENHVLVTQGFIGSDEQNNTTTLGRGGSDYSAALLAEALNAENLHIWTDVTGIFTTDPRLASNARAIPEISFDEAAEMATFGAKILHPATLIPAIRSGTRVFVGSSRAPEQGGTWIVKETDDRPAYRAIALRRDQVLVTLKSPNMLHATGFLAKVFTILAKHNVSVDLITTSEISVALTIDEPSNSSSQVLNEALLDELKEVCDVRVEHGLALVAVIGNQMHSTTGVCGDVLSRLNEYNLRMICHGASQHNLCFLANGKDSESIVEKLHQVLFEQTGE